MAGAILGISAFYHDSAAALLVDGQLLAAAQEERFTRRRHDATFPREAIRYCLRESGLALPQLDYVVFYDKPIEKFDRLLETYLACAPRGFGSFLRSMPAWAGEKLYLKERLKRDLAEAGACGRATLPRLLFTEHHHAHAAAAFYPSPFESATVLCMDGVGEWATTSLWRGENNSLTPEWQIDFPHSLGLLYSAFTYFTGFRVNSGEYKLMGLAPYGTPKYAALIRERLIDIKQDGTFRLDMNYFDYAAGDRMTNERFAALFGGPARVPDSPLTQREMDLAASVQLVTEEVVLRLARTAARETGAKRLCLAGGVALNCVANGRLLREGPFEDLWIQPAAGDAGSAVGAAFAVWHEYLEKPRHSARDAMRGALLGPGFSMEQIRAHLDSVGAVYRQLDDCSLFDEVAALLEAENVVGWFAGRMEFGPRALGSRSILGDARSTRMQSTMNLKIKFRESFRPFAPVVLAERLGEYFELDRPSPYMMLVAQVAAQLRIAPAAKPAGLSGIELLNVPRSKIPAVTHVDGSARVQTVHADTNPRLHALLERFASRTGCAVLVNTSFNVRGEPIVCTPAEAYACFMRTDMDFLVMENYLLAKHAQPSQNDTGKWQRSFEPD